MKDGTRILRHHLVVKWRSKGVDMWHVSDPFCSEESARKYAAFRRADDCEAEVWAVEKTERRIE